MIIKATIIAIIIVIQSVTVPLVISSVISRLKNEYIKSIAISIPHIFLFYLLLVLFKRARSKICVPSVLALLKANFRPRFEKSQVL